MSQRVQISLRVPPDLAAFIDRRVEQERRRAPSNLAHAVSRSTVIEDILRAELHRARGTLESPRTDGLQTPEER
jgi:Arc/MetJ-type ribon-helix-helix transcriptional regulator